MEVGGVLPCRGVHEEARVAVLVGCVGRSALPGNILIVVLSSCLSGTGKKSARRVVCTRIHERPHAAIDVGIDAGVVLVEAQVARGIVDDGCRGAGDEREDE